MMTSGLEGLDTIGEIAQEVAQLVVDSRTNQIALNVDPGALTVIGTPGFPQRLSRSIEKERKKKALKAQRARYRSLVGSDPEKAVQSEREALSTLERLQRIEGWKKEKLDAAFLAMCERARDLELAMTIDGRLFSPIIGTYLNKNQFISMIRHDLAEHFEGLPCKDRNAMIETMFTGFAKATKQVYEQGTHQHLFTTVSEARSKANVNWEANSIEPA